MSFDKLESTFRDHFASHNPDLLKHFNLLVKHLNGYFKNLQSIPVNPRPSLKEVQESVNFTLGKETYSIEHLIAKFTQDLGQHLLHVDHPMYFGVFNPNPIFSGVLAETLVAQMNAQLASSTSALYAIEMEKKLITYFGEKTGYPQNQMDGTFCTGGAEANITAILCALYRRAPEYFQAGSRKVNNLLTVYTSIETHHSIKKALRILGLGPEALRIIKVDENLRFSIQDLRESIKTDRHSGHQPILIVGTLGSTSAGVIDPIAHLVDTAKDYDVDLHIDAAWGGGALLLPEMAHHFVGLNSVDSITIDAHKWFAVPMTAGIFISKHCGILRSVFDSGESPYMPSRSFRDTLTEPFAESLQWSRRFMGLKLLFPLLVLGEAGYQNLFRHSIQLASIFRQFLLGEDHWRILNETSLPVVCFRLKEMKNKTEVEEFAESINQSGQAWVTSTDIGNDKQPVLRVGFPNFVTEEKHVKALFDLLESRRLRLQP